jgi:hypothetical protein
MQIHIKRVSVDSVDESFYIFGKAKAQGNGFHAGALLIDDHFARK